MTGSRGVRSPHASLAPASLSAEFVGLVTADDLADGDAILAVRNGDGEALYRVRSLFDGVRLTGWRLTKLGTEEGYTLPADLSGCNCPDRAYRPGRPGGCRHMRALALALPTVNR